MAFEKITPLRVARVVSSRYLAEGASKQLAPQSLRRYFFKLRPVSPAPIQLTDRLKSVPILAALISLKNGANLRSLM
jgi:hypothetical protein